MSAALLAAMLLKRPAVAALGKARALFLLESDRRNRASATAPLGTCLVSGQRRPAPDAPEHLESRSQNPRSARVGLARQVHAPGPSRAVRLDPGAMCLASISQPEARRQQSPAQARSPDPVGQRGRRCDKPGLFDALARP